MAALRVLCWALIFILRLRFPPGSSIATNIVISSGSELKYELSKNYVSFLLKSLLKY